MKKRNNQNRDDFLGFRVVDFSSFSAARLDYDNYKLLLDVEGKPLQIDARRRSYTTFSGSLKQKLRLSTFRHGAKSVPGPLKFIGGPLTFLKDFS